MLVGDALLPELGRCQSGPGVERAREVGVGRESQHQRKFLTRNVVAAQRFDCSFHTDFPGQIRVVLAFRRESALQRAHLRLNILYGAGKAALGAGDDVMASAYFVELLSITSGADEPRSRIKEIRAFMKTG